MKLVREHINEKFTEDSDPIKDMGIGQINVRKNFKSYKEGYKFICKFLIPHIIGSDDIKSIVNPRVKEIRIMLPIDNAIYVPIFNYVTKYLTINGFTFDLSGHDLKSYIMHNKLRESFLEDSDSHIRYGNRKN